MGHSPPVTLCRHSCPSGRSPPVTSLRLLSAVTLTAESDRHSLRSLFPALRRVMLATPSPSPAPQIRVTLSTLHPRALSIPPRPNSLRRHRGDPVPPNDLNDCQTRIATHSIPTDYFTSLVIDSPLRKISGKSLSIKKSDDTNKTKEIVTTLSDEPFLTCRS